MRRSHCPILSAKYRTNKSVPFCRRQKSVGRHFAKRRPGLTQKSQRYYVGDKHFAGPILSAKYRTNKSVPFCRRQKTQPTFHQMSADTKSQRYYVGDKHFAGPILSAKYRTTNKSVPFCRRQKCQPSFHQINDEI